MIFWWYYEYWCGYNFIKDIIQKYYRAGREKSEVINESMDQGEKVLLSVDFKKDVDSFCEAEGTGKTMPRVEGVLAPKLIVHNYHKRKEAEAALGLNRKWWFYYL